MKRCAFVAVLVAGCASGGGPPPTSSNIEQPIKVTLFRYLPDRAQRPVAEYVVMLSRTWTIQYGGYSSEPFERVVRNPRKGTEIVDAELDLLIKGLKKLGWDELPSTDVSGFDGARFTQLEREVRMDAMRYQQYIWITIQTPTETKTVFGKDALMMGQAVQEKFIRCRDTVLKGALQHTAQATAEPMRPNK